MDWRTWAYQRIVADVNILADVPEDSIYAASALDGAPANRPFIIVAFGSVSPELYDADAPVAVSKRGTVYVHDNPGDYLRIERVLENVRKLFAGTTDGMADGGIMALWEGESGDLADELFRTIMRYGELRFVGKVA